MGVDILLGLQWGDEGKGKIVDYLAKRYDIVARFQGGPNAGHTLEFDGIKHVLHQVPSGVFHPKIMNVIGNGVVLDPVVFEVESEALIKYNIKLQENLFISKRATLIIPTHKLLDQAYENAKGDNKIGSTLKGIGPTYQDKIGRSAIRVGDVLAPDFREKYDALVEKHKTILKFYDFEYSLEESEKNFFSSIEFIKTFKIIDSEYFLNQALKEGKSILAEGAQGALLDIDYGTYPFVTSSNTTVAGACVGLGIAPQRVKNVIGIFKAYCTRVGSGPFPTELFDDTGEKLREVGHEFGSTTGRARRCGWIDLPALKYAIMLNGVTHLLMMKADVLNSFDTIKVCTGYKVDGKITDNFPYNLSSKIEPILKEFKGWNCSLDEVTDFDTFPSQLEDYVAFLEKELEVPIKAVSIGPDRTETLIKDNILS